MILLEDITDLTIRDVTLRDAAFWTLHMAGCRRVRIRDIRILNDDRGANNDGIDPDCCQDVIISGCLIHTGDDAIVVKATGPMTRRYGPCCNVTITNCVLHSRDSALKIGTETRGDIRNITFGDGLGTACARARATTVRLRIESPPTAAPSRTSRSTIWSGPCGGMPTAIRCRGPRAGGARAKRSLSTRPGGPGRTTFPV